MRWLACADRRSPGGVITSTGVYLIAALVLFVVVGGGIVVGCRKYDRQDQ